QPVRAVLHDAARGDGSGTRDRQALRGGSRRPARHREHRGPRHDGADLAPQRERRRRAASPAGTERRMSGSTVLIVDDEQSLARSAKAFLSDHGYEAEVAGTGEQALELLAALQPDVVFADVRLPGMSGLDLLKRIRAFDPVIPVIMLTAYGSIAGAVEAVKLGAFDYVKKPVDLEELKLLADRARETRLLKEELSYYRRRATSDVGFEGLVGESRAVQAVLERARQVAALDETPPVLLTGETGTGNGLLARAIHAAGPRGAGGGQRARAQGRPPHHGRQQPRSRARGWRGAVSQGSLFPAGRDRAGSPAAARAWRGRAAPHRAFSPRVQCQVWEGGARS